MSLFSSIIDIAKIVAPMIPGMAALTPILDMVGKMIPMVESMLDGSSLPQDAQGLFGDAYRAAIDG